MINLRLTLVIILGKIVSFFLEHFGTGGTAAPGLIALKICPSLIKQLSSQLEKNIVVTGTNGKTTTTRMLAAILEQAHIKVIHNRYGSNLLRGIASTMIKETTLFGKMPKNCLGLWEVDEATLLPACQEVNPQIILITNLFRDQLDRYGEIDTLASNWQKALKMLPKDALVILNADDATVASLGKSKPREHTRCEKSKGMPMILKDSYPLKSDLTLEASTPGVKKATKILYFGLANQSLGGKKPDHASDATVCPYCFSSLKYQTCFVGHLGIYSCPKCEQIQPRKDVYLEKAKFLLRGGPTKCGDSSDGGTSEGIEKQKTLSINTKINNIKQSTTFTTTLPGTYNLYNFVAATALATALKIPKSAIIRGLNSFTPAFGRVEEIRAGDKTLYLFLVKNPTGFNEVIATLLKSTTINTGCYRQLARLPTPDVEKLTCLIAINDLIADGRDVSWLWDVDFEKLTPCLKKVIVSGIRAHDMALRLKYANVTMQQFNNLTIQLDLKKAINQLLTINNQQLYILPTYTAMLETRKILNKMGLVHSSWED